MNIDPGIKVEHPEIIYHWLEELDRFIGELEQQVGEDLHHLKQERETDENLMSSEDYQERWD